jgi:hypothetical protein
MIGVATQETGLLMEEDGAYDTYLGVSAGSILKLEESENINLSNEEFIDAQDYVQDQMDELINGIMQGDFASLGENEAEMAAFAKFLDSSEEEEEDYFEENDSVSSTSGSRKGEIERNFHELDNADFEFADKYTVPETNNNCTKKSVDEAKVNNDTVDNDFTKKSMNETEATCIDDTKKAMDVPEAVDTEKAMDVTEAVDTEKAMDVPEAVDTEKAMDEPEADDTEKAMDEPEADDTEKAMDEPEAVDSEKAMDEPEADDTEKAMDIPEAAGIDHKETLIDETDTTMKKQEQRFLSASEINTGVNPDLDEISDSVTEQSQTETEDQEPFETDATFEKQEPALLPASEMNVLEMLGVNPAWGAKISISDSVTEQSQTETEDEESIFTQDDSCVFFLILITFEIGSILKQVEIKIIIL